MSNLASERPHVLLVEDREEDIELTLRAFDRARLGNEVVVKRNGFEALEYLRHGRIPALILADVNMPLMNGIDFLEEVRRTARLRLVPVIMLSTSTEDRDMIASYERGANGYVRKPAMFSDFTDLIARLGMYWIVMNQTPRHA
jgi:two-component system, response regulator